MYTVMHHQEEETRHIERERESKGGEKRQKQKTDVLAWHLGKRKRCEKNRESERKKDKIGRKQKRPGHHEVLEEKETVKK